MMNVCILIGLFTSLPTLAKKVITMFRDKYYPYQKPLGHPKWSSNTPLWDRLKQRRLPNHIKFTMLMLRHYYSEHVFFDHLTYTDEVFFMARLKFEWDFINVKLSEKDKPKLEKFADKFNEDLEALMDEIVTLGYKVSTSYVDKQNSFVVTVSGSENSKFNNKCSMTSWSSSWVEAMFMMGYKVLEVTQGGEWKDFAQESDNWG